MPTSAERMRAYRERVRRGIRRLTVDVSEDDLRTLAERGPRRRRKRDHGQRPASDALLLAYDPTWPWGLGITLFGGGRGRGRLRCCGANALVADGRSTDGSGMASIVLEFAPQ